MQVIRWTAFILVSLAAVLIEMSLFRSVGQPRNAGQVWTCRILLMTPFVLFQIGLLVQRRNTSVPLRDLLVAALGGIVVFEEMFSGTGRSGDWRFWILREWLAAFAWLMSPAFLFWAIVERRKGLQFDAAEQRTARRAGIFVGLFVVLAAILSMRTIVQMEEPAQATIQRFWFMHDALRPIASVVPYYLVCVGLLTARGGRNQSLLIAGAVLLAVLGLAVSAFSPTVVRGEIFDNLARAFEREGSAPTWIAIAILVNWYVLPLWVMIWGLDWLAPISRGVSGSPQESARLAPQPSPETCQRSPAESR